MTNPYSTTTTMSTYMPDPTMFFGKAALINMINKGITAKITRMSTTNLNLTPVTTSWTLKRSVWYFSSPFVELFDTHGRREETEAGLEEANIATFWERKNWSITSRGHTYVAQVWIINVAKDQFLSRWSSSSASFMWGNGLSRCCLLSHIICYIFKLRLGTSIGCFVHLSVFP